jgi:hypothetical protein
MTFLDPLLLWGLPLAALPVIIHLFNRLRHRSVDWGAMMFLLSATRKSTRFEKIRQWLILAFRTLAIIALIVTIARPLAGGWIGWALHPAPDAILMVLDRSASMETKLAGGQIAKREEAVRKLSEAARTYQESSRLVLLDTALRTPQDLGDALSLPQLSMTAATDTGADLPAALQTGLDWIQRNKPGNVEIWIASDMQRSNWLPDSDRWAALSAQLAGLPQTVRFRLLTMDSPSTTESASVTILEINRRLRSEPPEIEVVMQIERNNPSPATLPVSITVDGNRATVELPVQGQSFRYRHKIVLDSVTATGWGKVEIPADDNPRDNVAYFVYGPPVTLRAAVVATDDFARKVLSLSAAPIFGDTNRVVESLSLENAGGINWQPYSLVLWQGPAPTETAARNLRAYLESGGSAILFPGGEGGRFEHAAWGNLENCAADKPWLVTRWEEKDGPLIKTEEGLSLPLNELQVLRRQVIGGEKNLLATFEDGSAFLTRRTVGKGELLLCATTPSADWSNLREGTVLVPLVQRLMLNGGRRFTQAGLVNAGEIGFGEGAEVWLPLETGKDIRTQAGIYRSQNRLIAANRPATETDPETVEPTKARSLFGNAKVQLFAEERQSDSQLQSELWRSFLFLMALFLLGEALLILPPKTIKSPSRRKKWGCNY